MKKPPRQTVTEQFNDKESLVRAVEKLATDDLWIDRVNDKKGLGRVSNRKLLHLHDLLSRVKERFGSRKKLIEELLKIENRLKDGDYRARLEGHGTPRLWDLYQAAEKRAGKSGRA
jgi:hypothetical protein